MKRVVLLQKLLFLFLVLCTTNVIAQVDEDDETLASLTARKYKDESVMLKSAYQTYTFDKGKNALGDKVVEIQEESVYDYLSIKKYASAIHPEFYNKFIQIKQFKRSVYYRRKWYALEKGGYDRSVTGDDIFFDDSRVNYFGLRFSELGSVQRVNVKKVYSDGKYLARLFFNTPYPVKEKTIEFVVPDWLTVNFIKMNMEGFKVTSSETKKGSSTIYKFTATDLAPVASESYSIVKASTDPHIIIQIKTAELKGETYKGIDKVDDIYAWNYRMYKMSGNDKEVLKPLVTKVTAGKKTDIDKIKAIYYWVQDNIRYIAYEDGYAGHIPDPVQNVFKNKYSDCKGMANILTEMLQLAGYDARFSWIGTRSIPYAQNTLAMCVNNHAISTLYFQNKMYFIDGTESYAPFGENAFRIQGKEVMVANGDKFEILKVPQSTANDNKLYTKADFTLVGESLKGKAKVLLTGNKRTQFHQMYQELPITEQKEFVNDYLEFGNDNLEASNIKTSDLTNRDIPVNIDGDIDLTNTVSTISSNKYIGIDFFPKSLERFVPDEKRVSGYDLDDLIKFEDEISLTIPADKKFIDKPDNLSIVKDGYEFNGEYTIVGNKLTLKKQLSIKNSIIKKADFDNWKKFIDAIKEFSKYYITVVKK